jgi:tripeptide aminopeptidase
MERFLTYVQVDTMSDRRGTAKPTTDEQWDLLRLLDQELRALGVPFTKMYDTGYLLGRIPSNQGERPIPTILLMAHVDVAEDAPGNGVKPQVHDYPGGDLIISPEVKLEEAEEPYLAWYKGEKIITSDGTTLLGADDKAGVAEIMTAIQVLMKDSAIPHGPIEILFTTDEETGGGMDQAPLEDLQATAAYTLDGGAEGSVESECYNAYGAQLVFHGKAIHPGYARGKLVNAINMANHFLSGMPRSESPEATDGRYGNFWAQRLVGGIERAELDVYIRDFDDSIAQRRVALLQNLAQGVELAFPGGRVELSIKKQYSNMAEKIAENPQIIDNLDQALRAVGLEPDYHPIRGGTDGSRLTEMGIPTPNIFAGGVNFHSRKEWVALSAMTSATMVILKLVEFWCK